MPKFTAAMLAASIVFAPVLAQAAASSAPSETPKAGTRVNQNSSVIRADHPHRLHHHVHVTSGRQVQNQKHLKQLKHVAHTKNSVGIKAGSKPNPSKPAEFDRKLSPTRHSGLWRRPGQKPASSLCYRVGSADWPDCRRTRFNPPEPHEVNLDFAWRNCSNVVWEATLNAPIFRAELAATAPPCAGHSYH